MRLFGSRAHGQALPDSDVDLLITAADAWLAQRDRFALLADLWGAVGPPGSKQAHQSHANAQKREFRARLAVIRPENPKF